MSKRSLGVAIAMALLMSLASSSPAHAGSVLITTDGTALSVNTGGSVSVLTVTYNVPINPGSFVLLPTTTVTGVSDVISGDVVKVTFNPVVPTPSSPAEIDFTVTTNSSTPPADITFSTFAFSGNKLKSAFGGVAVFAAVPEPASMSLLGIGMAGFFSFRRLLGRRRATA